MTPADPLKVPQLRLIAAIARQGQLGLAARDCGLSQPAASRMLAEIESLTGARVAERHARGLTLTPLGRMLARRADALITGLGDLSREIEEMKRGARGAAAVGAVTGGALGHVVPAVERLKAEAPGASVTIEVAPSDQLARELLAGRLDFALGRLPPGVDPADFDTIPARGEDLRLMVHATHPLAARAPVRLSDLGAERWVIQPRGTPIRAAVETAFHEDGAALPQDVTDTASLLVMLAMVAGSGAIAPVADEVMQLLAGPRVGAQMVALRLDRKVSVAPYFLLTRRGRQLSPLADRLRGLVIAGLGA